MASLNDIRSTYLDFFARNGHKVVVHNARANNLRNVTAEIPLGAIRTYARLKDGRELSFGAWADAVRAGRTFVSSGAFVELAVDDVHVAMRPGRGHFASVDGNYFAAGQSNQSQTTAA